MKNENLRIILSLLTIVALTSCNFNSTTFVDQKTIISSKPIEVATLMDISASTVKVINVPDSIQLLQFYRTVATGDNQSEIALGRIGIPTNSDQEFIRFTNLKIQAKHLEGTMTQRKKIMDYNRKAEYVNRIKEKEFLNAFNALKERNDQQTDIETAIIRSIKLLNEPNYVNHLKVLLVISDGYQITKGRRNFQFDFSSNPDIQIILVGWKSDTHGFKGVAPENLHIFEGFNNVPDYLQTILNNH